MIESSSHLSAIAIPENEFHTPDISCILPIYNGEKYIREAINSILDQSFSNFELIVIDDGSYDGSWAIVEQCARNDSRIRLIKQKNSGITAALNNGISIARGQYIARMDADDISLPNRFAFQKNYLDENSSCVLVGGLAEGFLGNQSLGTTSGGKHSITQLNPFPPKVAVAVHPMIMVRRKIISQIGGYRDLFPHAEDYDLFLRLSKYGSIDNPPIVLLRYRQHEASVSLRNLPLQERSAALAEGCAIYEAKAGTWLSSDANPAEIAADIWPASLLEAYITFRVLRRVDSLSRKPEGWRRADIFKVLLTLRPAALVSLRYWGLRARIAGYLAKKASKHFRAVLSQWGGVHTGAAG